MKTFKLWISVFLWAGIIFYLSSIPNLSSGLDEDFILRKIAHVIEYLILTFLLYRALKGSFALSSLWLCRYSAIVSVLYAASDEYHQTFVHGRHGCVRDVLIDSIGIVISLILVLNVKFIKSKEEL